MATRKKTRARVELTIRSRETGNQVLLCVARETLREAQDEVDAQWAEDYGKTEWEAVERITSWQKVGPS